MNANSATKCILSIVIPTYNRLPQLKTTLSLLAPQITEDVAIVILDNASTPAVTEEALHFGISLPGHIKIRRNKYNIGGNANLVKSLEVCDSPYVWVLGDDDIPAPDSIRSIMNAIAESPESVAYSFKFTSQRVASSTCVELNGLVDADYDWGELVFISNNVYNRGILMQYLEFGYEYAYSWMPLVAILLKALQQPGRTIHLSPHRLIEGNQPSDDIISWSPIEYQLRKYEILNIQMQPHVRRGIGLKISKANNAINSALICHLYHKTTRQDPLLMDRLLLVQFQYAQFSEKVKAILAFILIRTPRFTLLLLNTIYGKEHVRRIAQWSAAKLRNN
jgi:glycosyltransferase involved in cell wall biosynthesis